jgi:hypothetical protein
MKSIDNKRTLIVLNKNLEEKKTKSFNQTSEAFEKAADLSADLFVEEN